MAAPTAQYPQTDGSAEPMYTAFSPTIASAPPGSRGSVGEAKCAAMTPRSTRCSMNSPPTSNRIWTSTGCSASPDKHDAGRQHRGDAHLQCAGDAVQRQCAADIGAG